MESSGKLADTVRFLGERIITLRKAEEEDCRIVIAFAGTPGSGKSSVAAALLSHLHQTGVHDVVVVPMDGFHYPKTTLANFADPEEAFRRRGAPCTFDAEACVHAIKELQHCKVTDYDVPAEKVLLPSFDHSIQDPVESDIVVSSSTKVVILEGNYVLFDKPPWCEISTLVHDTWFVHVPRDVAKDRLVKRHLQAGIEMTPRGAEQRAELSDLVNGDLIEAHLIEPDVTIYN